MDIVPANITYTLAIVFIVFRELVNVLNNYCFHTENMLSGPQKGYATVLRYIYEFCRIVGLSEALSFSRQS